MERLMNTYKCARCKNTYEYETDWSEDDRTSEMKANFGDSMTTDQCSLVCDDCYKKMCGGRDA